MYDYMGEVREAMEQVELWYRAEGGLSATFDGKFWNFDTTLTALEGKKIQIDVSGKTFNEMRINLEIQLASHLISIEH